ncbi:MAG: hypothetical protein ACXWCC_11335, partial [Caldimonas sp.]
RSWSPRSFNVFDLCTALPGARIESLVLNDIGYDRGVAFHGPVAGSALKPVGRWYDSLRKRGRISRRPGLERWAARTLGRDQTKGEALAQIEVVVRKA